MVLVPGSQEKGATCDLVLSSLSNTGTLPPHPIPSRGHWGQASVREEPSPAAQGSDGSLLPSLLGLACGQPFTLRTVHTHSKHAPLSPAPASPPQGWAQGPTLAILHPRNPNSTGQALHIGSPGLWVPGAPGSTHPQVG